MAVSKVSLDGLSKARVEVAVERSLALHGYPGAQATIYATDADAYVVADSENGPIRGLLTVESQHPPDATLTVP